MFAGRPTARRTSSAVISATTCPRCTSRHISSEMSRCASRGSSEAKNRSIVVVILAPRSAGSAVSMVYRAVTLSDICRWHATRRGATPLPHVTLSMTTGTNFSGRSAAVALSVGTTRSSHISRYSVRLRRRLSTAWMTFRGYRLEVRGAPGVKAIAVTPGCDETQDCAGLSKPILFCYDF